MTNENEDKFARTDLPMPSDKPDFQLPISVYHIQLFNAYIAWGQETIGFGDLSITVTDGKIRSDTEGMGKEWVRRALYATVDKVVEEAFDENGRAKHD